MHLALSILDRDVFQVSIGFKASLASWAAKIASLAFLAPGIG
jgi:hypothetical protein